MIIRTLFMLTLYFAAFGVMSHYKVPFWAGVGVGSLFIVGAIIGSK